MSLSASLSVFNGPTSSSSIGAVRTVQIEQTEGKHDLVTVEFDLAAEAGLNSLNDQPGRFDITMNGYVQSYSGYLDVSSPGRTRGASQGRNTTAYLMGLTNVCRNSHARSWRATNPFNIATAVLAEYQLGLEMDAYEGAIQYMSQSGEETDWRFLVRLASEMGYSLVSDGVIVRFVNAQREAQRAPARSCPILYLPPSVNNSRVNVDSCSVKSSGSPMEADYRAKELTGVTETGELFSLDTRRVNAARPGGIRPSFFGPGTMTYQSMSDAMQEAERIRNQARWAFQLTAAISGTLDVRVGRSVYCNDPYSLYSGYWYVTDVKHLINVVSGMFKTQFTACREELAGTSPTIVGSPDAPGGQPPEAQLVAGRWRASKLWSRKL